MRINFLKSSKDKFLKVCFKATLFFVLILSVVLSCLSFMYASKYKAGFQISAPTITYSFAGAGTESNPYLINNATDLINLSSNVNGGEKYAGKYFILTNDIVLNWQRFTPIGNSYEKRFSGTFDGDNHIIENLYVETSSNYAGLFGVLGGATIKNIIVKGQINITGSGGSKYAGGISGYNIDSKFENCANYCYVDAEGDFSVNIGGISGYSSGFNVVVGIVLSKSSFTLCKNFGYLAGRCESSYVAGINGGGSCNTISRCFNAGDIIAGSDDTSSYAIAAGINVARVNNIEYCYNSGFIYSTASEDKAVTETYYFTLGNVCKIKSSSGTWYYYAENNSLDGNTTRWNDQIEIGKGNYSTYYLTPQGRTREAELRNFLDGEWQKKEIISLRAYSCGISPSGGSIKKCYNYGFVYTTGYCKSVWTYNFALYKRNWALMMYLKTFTFTFRNKRSYPISATASVDNCYYAAADDYYWDNYGEYKMGQDAEIFYNSDSVYASFEYKDLWSHYSDDDLIEIRISKPRDSDRLYFYTRVHKISGLVNSYTNYINIFECGKGNMVFNGKEGYITYEETVTLQGEEETSENLKRVFDNDSTWATSPAINNGYPYIKEMYW